jgi:hypothetical protein
MMSSAPAAKRARPPALDAAVSTFEVPGMGQPYGLLVLADGTRLVTTLQNRLQLLTPAGWLTKIAGDEDEEEGFENGQGVNSRFNYPSCMTVDATGHIVVVDTANNALRRVSKSGGVSTLAGNREEGISDGQGEAARFNYPLGVTMVANDEIVVADSENHAIRVVTPGGAVRTLAGNGEAGFADGQGAAARFNYPTGLARDMDGSILVAETGNNAVRRVTMEGAVSMVAGNGEAGYADGEGAAARFNAPRAVVVDKESTIVVAGMRNQHLRKIVGRQVTTLGGCSEAGTQTARGPEHASRSPGSWRWTSAGACSWGNLAGRTRCGWWTPRWRRRRGWARWTRRRRRRRRRTRRKLSKSSSCWETTASWWRTASWRTGCLW